MNNVICLLTFFSQTLALHCIGGIFIAGLLVINSITKGQAGSQNAGGWPGTVLGNPASQKDPSRTSPKKSLCIHELQDELWMTEKQNMLVFQSSCCCWIAAFCPTMQLSALSLFSSIPRLDIFKVCKWFALHNAIVSILLFTSP